MPFTIAEFNDPEKGVGEILAGRAAGLVGAGVSAEQFGWFRVDLIPLGSADDPTDTGEELFESYSRASKRFVKVMAIKDGREVEFTQRVPWLFRETTYTDCTVHAYWSGVDQPPRLDRQQISDCLVIAACFAWLKAPTTLKRSAGLYLESLMFEADERPTIEAAGVSKSQRRRAIAPRKEGNVPMPADTAREHLARAHRRKADRGESVKTIASNTGLSVRYVSEIATAMGWPGKKGRPAHAKK